MKKRGETLFGECIWGHPFLCTVFFQTDNVWLEADPPTHPSNGHEQKITRTPAYTIYMILSYSCLRFTTPLYSKKNTNNSLFCVLCKCNNWRLSQTEFSGCTYFSRMGQPDSHLVRTHPPSANRCCLFGKKTYRKIDGP